MFSDRITRLVNGVKAVGQTSIGFDNPVRAMQNGEFVQIGSDATYYQISACTSTTFTASPALVVQAADNAVITRIDKYALMPLDDLLDSLGKDDLQDDGEECEIYKLSLQARSKMENKLSQPIVSRNYDEFYTAGSEKLDFTSYAEFQGGLPVPNMWDGKTNAAPNTVLQLKHRPVVSVTTLKINGSTIPSTQYLVDYNRGQIYFASGFSSDFNRNEVIYVAGYASVPQEFIDIYVDLVNILHSRKKMGRNSLIYQGATGVLNPESNVTYRPMDDLDKYLEERLMDYSRYGKIAT